MRARITAAWSSSRRRAVVMGPPHMASVAPSSRLARGWSRNLFVADSGSDRVVKC